MNDIQLYDYQEEMRGRIDAAFKSCQSVMVQMPTGTGKTYLLASVVYGEIERSDKANVWIVVHRRELVEQIEEALEKFGGMLNDNVNSETTPWISSSVFSPWQSQSKHLFAHIAYRKRSLLSALPKEPQIKVTSIQWLSRHYEELNERPTLIVIDEAHHAVAKTYAEVMNAYPEAKKLGVTATPCRLRKRGFTDLFDTLLMSWSAKRFIAAGRLALYDYMSIKADSEDQRRILGLTQRGADGDFSLKEMSEKLDVKPSIERLCDTVLRYAADKKGITYAISIAHAEHIAEEYRRHGINAVAISSKTPKEERRRIIELFKGTSMGGGNKSYCASLSLSKQLDETVEGKADRTDKADTSLAQTGNIQVLVNVDLFGEGFDCPDVEFIQLARPTLSLAKYLQQVGRGMRVFEGKKYCLILDNVGLYRLFGLPSDNRDWQAMFEGKIAGKGNMALAKEQYDIAYSVRNEMVPITSDSLTELITVMTHDGQRMDLDAAYGYETIENENGLLGVIDKEGNEVLPCIYSKVDLKVYGFAKLYSRKNTYRGRPWIDLRNGVRFVKQPNVERHGFLDFSTTDGRRFYPRVQTRMMDENCFVLADTFDRGIDDGLRFKNFFIQPSEPNKLYSFKDNIDDVVLWEDEQGGLAWRKDWESTLHPITSAEWTAKKTAWKAEIKRFEEEKEQYIRYFKPEIKINTIYGKLHLADYEEPQYLRTSCITKSNYQVYYRKHWLDKWESVGTYKKVFPSAYGIRVVQNWNGKYLVRTSLFKPFETPEQEYEYAELQDNAILYFTECGKEYWVNLENKACFTIKPEFVNIGFMDFIKISDVYMERNTFSIKTYRRAEIRMYEDVCVLGNRTVIVNSKYSRIRFDIQQRNVDGKHFILKEVNNPNSSIYDMYYDGKKSPIIIRRKKDYEKKGCIRP